MQVRKTRAIRVELEHRPLPLPRRAPFLITAANSRIGTPYVPCDPDKIVAIVESKLRDKGRAFTEMDDTSDAIAGHIMEFFAHEVKRGRLPENLLPLQSGVGNIANAVLVGLNEGPFDRMISYTEVVQDGMLDMLDSGKLVAASATAFRFANTRRIWASLPSTSWPLAGSNPIWPDRYTVLPTRTACE